MTHEIPLSRIALTVQQLRREVADVNDAFGPRFDSLLDACSKERGRSG